MNQTRMDDETAAEPDAADSGQFREAICEHLPRLLKVLVNSSWSGLIVLVFFMVLAGVTPSFVVWLNALMIDRIVGVEGVSGVNGARGLGLTTLLAYSVLFPAIAAVLLSALADVLETAESFISSSWDGADIGLALEDDHRKRISAIFQDFARFPLSVRNNVDARQIAHDDEIKIALQRVGLGELTPELDTVLWKGVDGGTDLSGGQWQRLAMARTLLNAPSSELLIFDEPTSALDAHAEHEAMQLSRQMMSGKTSIVISHRLALTRFVDRILVLEQGRLVEVGSHQALMELKGRYHAMFSKQASYYVD